MKDVVQTLAIISSIGLIVMGVLILLIPTAESYIKIMAILGFIGAVLMIVSVEWWRRDEEEYERRIERRNKYRILKS